MDAILLDRDLSRLRSLILALGTFEFTELPQSERERVHELLITEFRNNPDAGIHGAAEWTLRRWGWDNDIEKAKDELQKLKTAGNRWFISKTMHTMIIVQGPVLVSMGSPKEELGRKPDEALHKRLIARRFAVSAKEVTRRHFQAFLRQTQGSDT